MWDDTGTDDREFVELFNPGPNPVDISGWTVAGRDVTTNNPTALIPGALGSNTTVLAPGGYYVLANAGTLNVNQTVAANFLENDNETVELWQGAFNTGTLVDALSYETNKGNATWFGAPGSLAGQLGPGIFGNSQGIDLTGTPLNSTTSLGRFVDGRDSNNNGRDFGLRPSTPGSSNAPGGTMTTFPLANPSPLSVGTNISNMVGTFVTPKVIDPVVVDANNPNLIPAAPYATKAYVSWDPSGGGNGSTSTAVFNSTRSGFDLYAYLDTRNLPLQSNASNVTFTGSEITLYGIGSGDALVNLTDLTGNVGLPNVALPAAETANGFTGIAWIYEKVGESSLGAGNVSEKLHLVDANDGGDADLGGNTALDWTILATFDLSTLSSDWYRLTLDIDALGNGVASFNGQIVNFTTSTALNSGAFNVGYRENLQVGADGTPDALMRPATFTVPEPATLGLLAGAGVLALRRRK